MSAVFYSAPIGERRITISMTVCVAVCPRAKYLDPLDQSSGNFVSRSPVTVARSSFGGVALRYVLQVLWMTSRLAAVGATPKGGE